MEGVKMIKVGLISFPAGNLSRGFDGPVRGGDREAIALAIGSILAAGDGTSRTERDVIIALAGAMIRYVDRRSRLVLLYGGIGRHLRLASLADYLTDWAFDLYKAPVNYQANAVRLQSLCRYLDSMSTVIPELAVLRSAAGAVEEVLIRVLDETTRQAA